ncbi:hypothetical protein E2C01_006090 [Portunus trituberculatus]|uniref:Uncharacterized protein n=1 Tax=Portunus trituberculatus TaxID=210409 RepID=A0A5B7CVE0_PORTR|nr:hypothetical protein [Portunus trituberculatus]
MHSFPVSHRTSHLTTLDCHSIGAVLGVPAGEDQRVQLNGEREEHLHHPEVRDIPDESVDGGVPQIVTEHHHGVLYPFHRPQARHQFLLDGCNRFLRQGHLVFVYVMRHSL